MFKKLRRWYWSVKATRNVVTAARRALQLLQAQTSMSGDEAPLTDQEVLLVVANIGLSVLHGQCALNGLMASMPNAVFGQVVEVPLGPLGKEQLH